MYTVLLAARQRFRDSTGLLHSNGQLENLRATSGMVSTSSQTFLKGYRITQTKFAQWTIPTPFVAWSMLETKDFLKATDLLAICFMVKDRFGV